MDYGVGREVKRLREERDWSQARLAVEAGMSVSGISMIENAQRNLTTATLAKLARAFDIEVRDLFPLAQDPLLRPEELEEAKQRSAATWEVFGSGEGCGIVEGPVEYVSSRLEDPELRSRLLSGPRDELDRELTQLVYENKRLREELLNR